MININFFYKSVNSTNGRNGREKVGYHLVGPSVSLVYIALAENTLLDRLKIELNRLKIDLPTSTEPNRPIKGGLPYDSGNMPLEIAESFNIAEYRPMPKKEVERVISALDGSA